MSLSTWFLYMAAVLVLTITPGPSSVLMCVSTSVNLGPRKALVVSLGSAIAIAIAVIMALSMLGLSATLAASETLFSVLKWAGAAYLACLGFKSLLFSKASEVSMDGGGVQAAANRNIFGQGFLVGASNPKALLFFGALFPQFIDPSTPQGPQLLVLGLTFVFFGMLWLTIYALGAARAKCWLAQSKRARLFNRATGVVFLAAAGLLASSKRGAA